DAANMLLGRTAAWPDGRHLSLVISTGEAGEAAIEAITGRDSARLLRAWKRLVFSGAAAMPVIAEDDVAACALVARTPDAVVLLRTRTPMTFPPGLVVVLISVTTVPPPPAP